jgi:hypothetical protein
MLKKKQSQHRRCQVYLKFHKLSTKLKHDEYYTKKPDINMLKDISKDVNSIPLPDISDTPYVQLPSQEQALIRNNYQIYSDEILSIFKNTIIMLLQG